MCGIVGIFTLADSRLSTKKSSEIFEALLLEAQSRGKDASGIALVEDAGIAIFKAPLKAAKLVQEPFFSQHIRHFPVEKPFRVMGHSRMETDGSFLIDENNQPVVRNGCAIIHNGIIVNHEKLWTEEGQQRSFGVDTEIINILIGNAIESSDLSALSNALVRLEGSFSIAVFFEKWDALLLATNTGSLYLFESKKEKYLCFASERAHLTNALSLLSVEERGENGIRQLMPGAGLLVELDTLESQLFHWKEAASQKIILREKSRPIHLSSYTGDSRKKQRLPVLAGELEKLVCNHYRAVEPKITALRRCSRCILPETMPFIRFDFDGVCSYCKKHQPREMRGVKTLLQTIEPFRTKTGNADCIVCLSGGRDSSYALHYVKKELGLHPIAYSYDWGMLTDLGRRNQARMTGALGVEHLLVAADIQKKRSYIRKNIEAWLEHPNLGMIPLFMAGDKHYFYHVDRIRKTTGIPLVIYADNALEKTDFKYGFAGVELTPEVGKAYDIGRLNTLKLLTFYGSQYLRNPSYLNTSMWDTFTAYLSSYFVPKDYLYLFRYVLWDETTVTSTLTELYDWELARDSSSSWRIGDGTAGFYNYIYYSIAGFTEHDTFRSNQIREGVMERKEALRLSEEGNKPRIESILWYCETLGLDPVSTLARIHAIPALFRK